MDDQGEQIRFPYQLKQIRLQRGWPQARLAEELGTDNKTISRWETGQVLPSLYFREKLCSLFALSVQDLGLVETSVSSIIDPSIPLSPAIPLVGRDSQLSMLRQRLRNGGNSALSALSGLPGIGKTALAVALANDPELQAHFKDGILWAGLGPEPNILGHVLRWGAMLGIPATETSDIEAGLHAFHQAIHSRTMLFIFDDVWRPEDALCLKVGGPNCAHLVTTRFAWIATQIASDGAMVVEELTSEDGVSLLQMLASPVVEQEPQHVRELVEAVGGLPLALNLIGNHLRIQSYRNHPRRLLTTLQLLCNDATTRLHLQETRSLAERHSSRPGSASISLHSIISVSVEHLRQEERTALYALAIFPPKPHCFSEEAALTIADCRPEILDTLVDTGLLQLHSGNQYRLHPTIHDYTCNELEQSGDFDLVYHRLVAYITHFVEVHSTDYLSLEREHATILAALAVFHQDAKTELPRLVCASTPFLLARGFSSTVETYLYRAYQIAAFFDNRVDQARVLIALEQVYQQQDKRIGNILEKISAELSQRGL